MTGEQELVRLLKTGSADAFEQMITRCRAGAEAYACSLLHDSQAAEDAVQEAFSRLYAVRTDIDENRSFSAESCPIRRFHRRKRNTSATGTG